MRFLDLIIFSPFKCSRPVHKNNAEIFAMAWHKNGKIRKTNNKDNVSKYCILK